MLSMRLLLLSPMDLAAPASAAGASLSPACSMAGALTRDGGDCACLEGWRGARCSILDLEPAASVEQLKAWAPKGRTAWGRTVVADPSGKGYHMVVAVMEGALGLVAGWTRNSTVEHLFSPASPAGPFAPLGPNPMRLAEAHNPSIAYDPRHEQV